MNVHASPAVITICLTMTPLAAAETFVVNQRHSTAADENAGTEEKPFATIAAAARTAKAGDEVIIHAGVYREKVLADGDPRS